MKQSVASFLAMLPLVYCGAAAQYDENEIRQYADDEVIIGEEDSTEAGHDEVRVTPAGTYKDEDECEDACEDRCERMCERKCRTYHGDCEDDCEDRCEEGCEPACAGFRRVFGPARNAVLLSLHFNALVLHSSTVTDEENHFLESTGIVMIYELDDGTFDTLGITYSFMSYAAGVELTYFFGERFGVELAYEYSFTDETMSTLLESFTEQLMSFHTAAAGVRVYVWRNARMGISLSPRIGASFGSVTRLPVLYVESQKQAMSDADRYAFREVNRPLTAVGMNATVRANFHYMINRFLMIFGGPVYTYGYLTLSGVTLRGYPATSNNHDLGLNVNIALLLNGLNTNVGR